jgi:hypothetical protein
MNIREQDLAAIVELGYSPAEAWFLYVVATHSGYFQPRQAVARNGSARDKRPQRLIEKLKRRGQVAWREYQGMGGVYHLLSKTIYRRIGKTDLRTRLRHSAEYIRTRLLLLDFILEHPHYDYFETETDKLAYFCETRGIPEQILPARTYSSASGARLTCRYFADKFPVFLDRSAPVPVVTLSYIDPGQNGLAGFPRHLRQYRGLFSWLGDFTFLYVSDSSAHLAKAEECFESLVKRGAGEAAAKDVCLYFERRRAWEQKQYARFSTEDLEALHNGKERYASDELECLYASWTSGEIDDSRLQRTLGHKFCSVKIEFRTWLARQKKQSAGKSS